MIVSSESIIHMQKSFEEKWTIDRQAIQMLKKIGTGEMGEVWQGLWNSKFEVAIRTSKPGSSVTVSTDDFFHEAEMLVNLQHPNIIKLYGVCMSEEPCYIVYEYMSNRSLLNYLRSDGRNLRLSVVIDMCSQIAKGMSYLETNMCVHRNLAARSILVNENKICKISGFELALITDGEESVPLETTISEHRKYTIKWRAPESILFNHYSTKSDVWSFGVLLYEAATYGRIPYAGMSTTEVADALENRYRIPCPPYCSEKLYNIMLDCWSEEPRNRLTFATLQSQLEDFYRVDKWGYDSVEL